MKIDKKDVGILKMLQQNDRTTVKDIAESISLSPSPTFDRQKRLEKEGVITRYAAVVDYLKAGNSVIVLCFISLKEQNDECSKSFVEAISKLDEVTECYNISGEYDYIAKIYVRDMEHFADFVRTRLGSLDSVSRYKSTIVISEVKNSHSVPVYPSE